MQDICEWKQAYPAADLGAMLNWILQRTSPEMEALEWLFVLQIEARADRKAAVSDKMVVEKAHVPGTLQDKLPTGFAFIYCFS